MLLRQCCWCGPGLSLSLSEATASARPPAPLWRAESIVCDVASGVGTSVDIDEETKRILLRSRQATSRPSPEPSPVSSELGSVEDLSAEAAADEKAKEQGVLDREVHLQEADPFTFLEFGSEIWR